MFSNWLAALKSNRASVAVQTGLVLIALIGMVALGTEMVFVLYKHRQMQSAADAAATGAVTAILAGSPSDFHTEALAIAANAGFTDGVDDVSVDATIVDLPDGDSGVQVIISQPQTLGLVNLFRSGIFDVGARAVAKADVAASYCILALDDSRPGALTIENGGVIANSECGVAVNSSSDAALTLGNNAIINGPVNVHGFIDNSNIGKFELNGAPVKQNAPIIDDPYADRTIQTPPACTGQQNSGGNRTTVNLTPGRFCSGWDFGNNVTLNLAPGAYYIDAKLKVGNGAIINGIGGVTLIVNGNYAIDIANSGLLMLTAPTSGPYAGLAILSSRTATSDITQIFSNNGEIRIEGAIYMPNQVIRYQNNAETSGTRCTQIIGRIIITKQNVTLNNDCAYSGTSPITSSASRLVQ